MTTCFPPLLIAAISESGSSVQIISPDWQSWIYLVVFTIIYDAFEIRLHSDSFRQVFTFLFISYAGYHCLLGVLACFFLAGRITAPWLLGLVSAISTETILSNTDVKIGNQSLLPIVEQFRGLRAKMVLELGNNQVASERRLLSRLSNVRLVILEREWTNEFTGKVGLGAATQKIADLRKTAHENQAALKSQYASDLLAACPEFIKEEIKKWEKDTRRNPD